MGKRSLVFGLVALALACGDDEGLRTGEMPASADCLCPLDLKIENLAVCISPTTPFASAHLYSTHLDPATSRPACEPWRDPQPRPVNPWSALRGSSSCAGSGEFCVAIRSGNAGEPAATDCQVARVCSSVQVAGGEQVMELPPLPSWVAESSECAQRYERDGGYLEFVFESEQLGCGTGDGSRRIVPLCPTRCEAAPTGPGCEVCGNGPAVRF